MGGQVIKRPGGFDVEMSWGKEKAFIKSNGISDILYILWHASRVMEKKKKNGYSSSYSPLVSWGLAHRCVWVGLMKKDMRGLSSKKTGFGGGQKNVSLGKFWRRAKKRTGIPRGGKRATTRKNAVEGLHKQGIATNRAQGCRRRGDPWK